MKIVLERIEKNVGKAKMINSLLNDKISDWSKLKAFAENKINVTETLKFVLGKIENIVGKGENLFPQCFQHVSFSGLLKVEIVW